jgi:isoquinoline 1-oxidoreductase beta subunit
MSAADAGRAPASPSRRRLLLGGGLVGGALVVGYITRNAGDIASAALSLGAEDPPPSAFGPFITIDRDGWVTVVNKHQEMGQGTHAGLAAIVAEELDADWNTVRIAPAPANAAVYKNLDIGIQGTASSTAIRGSWNQLRHAGAAARAMFVQAAATRWGIAATSIRVEHGVVFDVQTDCRATFAELLPDAARIPPPSAPVLKDPARYTLVGTDRVRRKDSLAKSTGRVRYTQDVRLPHMLVAMVAHPPRFGGTVATVDAAAARRIPGVVDVFEIPSGVAVVATDTYAARRGRAALGIAWNDNGAETRSSADLAGYYRRIAAGDGDVPAHIFQSAGDASNAFRDVALDAAYDFPYLAHAPMETMDCVAQVSGWKVTLTCGSQMQTLDQVNAARTVLTLPGLVDVATLPAGGSFGRRANLSSDYVVECVHVASRVGRRPVKLLWTREDDMRGGYYRPMAHHRLWIACGADGFPSAWRHHAVVQRLVPLGPNEFAVDGVKGSPYLAATPVVDLKAFTPSVGVPVGFWRSVGHTHTALVMEHTIDRLARRARHDPAAYRRAIYKRANDERRLRVLDLVCDRAGWGAPLDDGWARGLAVHESYGTVVAQVAEVALVAGTPKVRRVVCAVDCGIAISPNQIAAQIDSGVCFGLSAALYGRVTLVAGEVQQTNFDTYRVVRMHDMPVVETHIVPSTHDPSGMGEPGTPLIAPAVANALLSLTGAATSSLPFVTV